MNVKDQTPQIISPGNYTYEFGTLGQSLNWTVIGQANGGYLVYRNGTLVADEVYTEGEPFFVDITGLTVGTYNYTVLVTDAYNGHSNIDTVWVTVTGAIINEYPNLSTTLIVIPTIAVICIVRKKVRRRKIS